jgi:hypothetical protein
MQHIVKFERVDLGVIADHVNQVSVPFKGSKRLMASWLWNGWKERAIRITSREIDLLLEIGILIIHNLVYIHY